MSHNPIKKTRGFTDKIISKCFVPKYIILFFAVVFIGAACYIYNSFFFANLLYQHYPGVSYYYIAKKVTKGEPDIIKKSQMLVDYINQNVFTGPFPVKDLPPISNLIRGVGWCDQVSHLFLRLIGPLDVRGYLVFLNRSRDGTGASPHSIAVITPNTKEALGYDDMIKQGVIVDVMQGVIFKNENGGDATFGDVCARNILESQRKYFTGNPGIRYDIYCNKAGIFLYNTPISMASQKRQLFYKYFYSRLPEWAIRLYQDMTLDRWYRRRYPKELGFLYYKARNYHIYERFGEAIKLYDIVIEKTAEKEVAAKCLFFKGMALYRMGRIDAARKEFEKAIKDYPDSPWSSPAGEWLRK
ncbi:MAG: tetratricopeptide repeat protein [Candidatus Omnitrophota bacterium]